MNPVRIGAILCALVSQVLFTGGATAQTGYEPLADYYVSEFRSFDQYGRRQPVIPLLPAPQQDEELDVLVAVR